MDSLIKMLITHEGLRLKPYRDSVGKLTIGVGRNLDDNGITEEEALSLLKNDIRRVIDELKRALPFFTSLNGPRREVLIDMGFNLGLPGLLGFKKMIFHLSRGDYKNAAREMLDSKWARQVKGRAEKLAEMMRDGVSDNGR